MTTATAPKAKGTLSNDPEIAALSRIGKVLNGLEADAQERVVRYLADRFDIWPEGRVSTTDRDVS